MTTGHIDLNADYVITGRDLAYLTKEAFDLITRYRPGNPHHQLGYRLQGLCDRIREQSSRAQRGARTE